MILIGLGANVSSAVGGPAETLTAALSLFEARGLPVVARSRWYRSAPVPVSDQPWFVNAVVATATTLAPRELLAELHRIEGHFGRHRRTRNEPRPIDLDLLAYHDVIAAGGEGPDLPHPRLGDRAFVLLPLGEIAPGWRHPQSGLSVDDLIARLPLGQTAEPMAFG